MIALTTPGRAMSCGLTPGEYLQKRREAAGLSRSDIVRLLGPTRLSRPLELIEADARQPAAADVGLLRTVFVFDPAVLGGLLAGDAGDRICTSCGCSEWDPCVTAGPACQWVAIDRCSACPSPSRAVEIHHEQ